MNQEEAINWIAGMFNESASDLSAGTLREDIPEWDSLGVLTLMAEMDEKFGIILSDEDTEKMTLVDDLLQTLRENGKLES